MSAFSEKLDVRQILEVEMKGVPGKMKFTTLKEFPVPMALI